MFVVLHHGPQAINLLDSKPFPARGVPGWFVDTAVSKLSQLVSLAYALLAGANLMLLPFLHSRAIFFTIIGRIFLGDWESGLEQSLRFR
jgi:hypothetical protein